MIDRIDHVVLTVRSVDATCGFYERVLGFRRVDQAGRPTALLFGRQKLNVHEAGHTFDPKAAAPTPGSFDACFVTTKSIDDVRAHLAREGVIVEVGPVEREGAQGKMTSVYFRDPDGNLIEVSRYGLSGSESG
jgi:catechol 2,3-dioxygenase-like lactoylglutathione lyase family enzyme